jgi:hypothetical protein
MTTLNKKQGISLWGVGHATSLTLVISFTLCVAFDLVFPEQAMYEAWQKLLPGFEWISLQSFFLGVAEVYGYGWFFALIWTPVYNLTVTKESQLNT